MISPSRKNIISELFPNVKMNFLYLSGGFKKSATTTIWVIKTDTNAAWILFPKVQWENQSSRARIKPAKRINITPRSTRGMFYSIFDIFLTTKLITTK